MICRRCLECQRKIGWLRQLFDRSFCSDEHERIHQERWQQLALDRLWHRVKPDAQEANFQPAPASQSSVPHNEATAGFAFGRHLRLAVSVLLPILFMVGLLYALSTARQSTTWVVLNLPDPPPYQERLPNPPGGEEAELIRNRVASSSSMLVHR